MNNIQLEKLLATLKVEESKAIVEYAGVLTEVQQKALEQKVISRYPEATEVTFRENPDLIAGLRVLYQDYVYDDSAQGRVEQLKNTLETI